MATNHCIVDTNVFIISYYSIEQGKLSWNYPNMQILHANISLIVF